jgi:hypothetical protein
LLQAAVPPRRSPTSGLDGRAGESHSSIGGTANGLYLGWPHF